MIAGMLLGAAGIVLATRLSELPDVPILVALLASARWLVDRRLVWA